MSLPYRSKNYEEKVIEYANYLKERQRKHGVVPANLINESTPDQMLENYRLDANTGEELYSKENERYAIMEGTSPEETHTLISKMAKCPSCGEDMVSLESDGSHDREEDEDEPLATLEKVTLRFDRSPNNLGHKEVCKNMADIFGDTWLMTISKILVEDKIGKSIAYSFYKVVDQNDFHNWLKSAKEISEIYHLDPLVNEKRIRRTLRDKEKFARVSSSCRANYMMYDEAYTPYEKVFFKFTENTTLKELAEAVGASEDRVKEYYNRTKFKVSNHAAALISVDQDDYEVLVAIKDGDYRDTITIDIPDGDEIEELEKSFNNDPKELEDYVLSLGKELGLEVLCDSPSELYYLESALSDYAEDKDDVGSSGNIAGVDL